MAGMRVQGFVPTLQPMTTDSVSRRQAIAGAATIGIGIPLLASCSSASNGSASDATTGGSTPTGPLGATSEIPVGGGTVFKDAKVVVTQPTKGDFKGFSATCTHQGCVVATVEKGTIKCPCHGSMFSIEDGSVQGGPAPSPLPAVELSVKGTEISLA